MHGLIPGVRVRLAPRPLRLRHEHRVQLTLDKLLVLLAEVRILEARCREDERGAEHHGVRLLDARSLRQEVPGVMRGGHALNQVGERGLHRHALAGRTVPGQPEEALITQECVQSPRPDVVPQGLPGLAPELSRGVGQPAQPLPARQTPQPVLEGADVAERSLSEHRAVGLVEDLQLEGRAIGYGGGVLDGAGLPQSLQVDVVVHGGIGVHGAEGLQVRVDHHCAPSGTHDNHKNDRIEDEKSPWILPELLAKRVR
mmetsp:Transcript_65393/g.202397  ORF Transcript_65393/g.202397 Transcript_65393/m.202397 type:complete len:256 (-) Transcript_65393:45-812(-)